MELPLDDCETHSKTFEREFNRDVPKYDLMVGYSHLTAKSPPREKIAAERMVPTSTLELYEIMENMRSEISE